MIDLKNLRLQRKPPSSTAQAALGLGYQLMAAFMIFAGSGYYLDKKYDTSHLYTLIGVALAFLYGGYEVWKLVTVMEREDRNKK